MKTAKFVHFGYAYDSTTLNKNYINYLEKTLDFLRVVPEKKWDHPASATAAEDILNSIDTTKLGSDEFILFNYYTDTTLIKKWSTHPNKDKITLANMESFDRLTPLIPEAEGSKFQLPNAYLPPEFFTEINSKFDPPDNNKGNKDFSQASITLFQMCYLYYIVGIEQLDNDFSRGYEIVITLYSLPDMININGTYVTLVSSNKLQPRTQSGIYGKDASGDIVALNTGDFVENDPETVITYIYTDGFPIEYICDVEDYVINAKPTSIIYVVFMTYKSLLTDNVLAKYESHLIDSLNAAVEYVNNNVYYIIYYIYIR